MSIALEEIYSIKYAAVPSQSYLSRRPKKRCYVAGPMRGYPNLNFPEFDRVSGMLRSQGWYVISPADHDRSLGFDPGDNREYTEQVYNELMRWDIGQVLSADAIYMMRNWQSSEGATVEFTVAKAIGITIMYEEDTSNDS